MGVWKKQSAVYQRKEKENMVLTTSSYMTSRKLEQGVVLIKAYFQFQIEGSSD